MKFRDFVDSKGRVDQKKIEQLSEVQRAALVQLGVIWSHLDTYNGMKRKVEWYRRELQKHGSWAEHRLLKEMDRDIKALEARIDEFKREFDRLEQVLQSTG